MILKPSAVVVGAVRGAVRSAVPQELPAAIQERIVERVIAAPELQHAVSIEPWYQSRSNWAAIISIATPIVSIIGFALSPEEQIAVAGFLSASGGLWAAYLARRARTASKPLGE